MSTYIIRGKIINYRRYSIGLNTWRYIFKCKEEMEILKERLKNQGEIYEIYLNNSYGFEFKRNRIIY